VFVSSCGASAWIEQDARFFPVVALVAVHLSDADV